MPNVGGNFAAGVQGGNVLYNRRRQNRIGQIMSQYADNPEEAFRALQEGGFGPESIGLENAQMAPQRAMQMAILKQKLQNEGFQSFVDQLRQFQQDAQGNVGAGAQGPIGQGSAVADAGMPNFTNAGMSFGYKNGSPTVDFDPSKVYAAQNDWRKGMTGGTESYYKTGIPNPYYQGRQAPVPGQGGVSAITSGPASGAGMSPADLSSANKEKTTKLYETDNKYVSDLRDVALKSQQSRMFLDQMKESMLNPAGLYSGAWAEGRTGLANMLQTLAPNLAGIDLDKLANTQQFGAFSNAAAAEILKSVVGSAQISDRDVMFVKSLFPRLEQQPQARVELINFLYQKLNQNIDRFNAADKYFRTKGNLTGYDYGMSPSGGFGKGIPKPQKSDIEYLRANNTPEMQKAFQKQFGYLPNF